MHHVGVYLMRILSTIIVMSHNRPYTCDLMQFRYHATTTLARMEAFAITSMARATYAYVFRAGPASTVRQLVSDEYIGLKSCEKSLFQFDYVALVTVSLRVLYRSSSAGLTPVDHIVQTLTGPEAETHLRPFFLLYLLYKVVNGVWLTLCSIATVEIVRSDSCFDYESGDECNAKI